MRGGCSYGQSIQNISPTNTKMKTLLVVAFVAVIAMVSGRPEEKYTTKYDNVDLDQILKSDRLLKNYFNCLMDRGTCTPDGEELKKALPDALLTECGKCSEKQKEGTRKVIHYLIENKRDWWNELESKYDKEGTYRKKYKEHADKEGLNL